MITIALVWFTERAFDWQLFPASGPLESYTTQNGLKERLQRIWSGTKSLLDQRPAWQQCTALESSGLQT